MPLTDTAIRNAKAGDAVQKLSDGEGLQLWVMPTGKKLWNLAYRYEGKQKKLSIGPYPQIDLRSARATRDKAKDQLRAGQDPSEQKKLGRIAASASKALTFGLIADELIARKRREKKAERTIEKVIWLLDIARPALGRRPVADISAAEVLAVLRKVEARGKLETARRLRATIGQVFRYAIATARASNDPTFALRGALIAPTVTHHAAITAAKEVGGLLRAIDVFMGQPATRAALQLMALLFPRPGEVRNAEWTEFDLDSALWTIPPERMKMRRPHHIPLPSQAIAILKDLRAITGKGKLVFPSVRTTARPMSENTINAALRRMGYGVDEMTGHGFRAAASTLLNESGKWNPDAVERALAHQDEDETRRAYARGQHWDERVRMSQWWADYLDTLRSGAKVIAMPTKEAG
ncbi:tyrosine-type recombinase/integrase [Bosea sp. PAMC 26642]|uniref:tyrosine-type recombinase/integrase n=1 Tax=Bosea sp. (strain PAMC 26642) TaxID=1792307 RepID=UPI00077018B2|nr:integrase arm-type DNA-binding domain-containing protein [Bosea sp. PAMC 26642]AMJ63062.1 integrase [Bosea sp. PAMC 26642]